MSAPRGEPVTSSSPPVEWLTCSESGCSGVQLNSGKCCLAHAAEGIRNAALRNLTDTGNLDVRGVVLSEALGQRIADAVPAGKDGRWLANAIFTGATFEGDALFSKVTFLAEATFDQVTFKGRAQFNEVTFQRDAVFDRAEFHGHAL